VKLARGVVALLGSSMAIGACTKGARVDSRAVALQAPAACAPGAGAFALYYAFGDFQPPPSPPSLPLSNVGAELAGFPADAQEIVVDVTDATEGEWVAHGLLAASGNVDLLLLADQLPCALSGTIAARTSAAVGAIDATHVLVAGGSANGAVPTTELVDLSTGTTRALAAGLLVPRSQATVTAWSGGAVVAGGVRPDTGETLANAEVFVSAAGDFDGELVTLSEPRARQGAVAMTNGETLLVGGVGSGGAVLGSMEIVDASSHRAQTAGLASLAVPRADPQVLRLASGEILVAGGVDGNGAPVPTLEWFARDASASSRATQDLVASSHEAFVPLAAGGALAVIAPDTATPGFQNVWVITAAGGLEAATPIDGTLSDARLFDGTAQSPVLWTGDRWLQWQPWQGVFTALAPAFGAPGPSGDPIASPEPGLGVWIDGAAIDALRFGARGPYVSETTPLLVGDTSFTGPDRLAGADPAGAIVFDATAGLSLQLGASVFVTDATYASFALDAETPGASPPSVVLRDASGNETVLDAASCPVAPSATLHVERDGDGVVRASSGGSLVRCTVAPASAARVSIGVRGQSSMATSVVRSLAITRL
jgi:hypothetical protein